MREVELKSVVEENFVLRPERLTLADARLHSRRSKLVTDRYFDTDDLRLARWGVTFRWRDGEGWTVKVPRPARGREVLDRDEIHIEGTNRALPRAGIDLVAPFSRGRPLGRVADLCTTRTSWLWKTAEGRLAGELVDDRVLGRAAGRDTGFREIEFELGPGGDDIDLAEVAAALRLDGAEAVPKLVRVLGPDAAESPDVVVPVLLDRPSGADVIQLAIASSVERLLLHVPAARLGVAPRGVHQARVATRRLRSDLSTFGPLLDQAWADELRGELRWLAAELGRVRDDDVLDGRLRSALEGYDGSGGGEIRAHLSDERDEHRASLLAHLADERALRLYERLVDAAEAPKTRGRADKAAHRVLPPLVAKAWRKLRKAVRRLDSVPTDEELHEVRILAKRARYAADAVAPAIGKDARRFAKSAARVQRILGESNDDAVAADWLERSATEGLSPTAAFAAGRLVERLRPATGEAGSGSDRDAWRTHYDDMARRADWLD